MRITTIAFHAFILIVCNISCGTEDHIRNSWEHGFNRPTEISDEEYEILSQTLSLPRHLDTLDLSSYTFDTDRTNLSFLFGRILFYDTDLSADGTVSCASCHKQELAFGDNVPFSKGANNHFTDRNSIALGSFTNFNNKYYGPEPPPFFWDGRAADLSSQMAETIENEKEMGTSLEHIADIVMSKPYYNILLERISYQPTSHFATENQVLNSLSEFVRTLEASNSKLDRVKEANRIDGIISSSKDWEGLTQQENKGKAIFIDHCAKCHQPSIMGQDATVFLTEANIGLDLDYQDKGIGAISGWDGDNGKFKTPSLKNIELTAPYMHDGRFNTLDEVIDHYNKGIKKHKNLNIFLRDRENNPIKMNLSKEDKKDLISFLQTLTDRNLTTKSAWSDPFIR